MRVPNTYVNFLTVFLESFRKYAVDGGKNLLDKKYFRDVTKKKKKPKNVVYIILLLCKEFILVDYDY